MSAAYAPSRSTAARRRVATTAPADPGVDAAVERMLRREAVLFWVARATPARTRRRRADARG